jgi:hypothetical protein
VINDLQHPELKSLRSFRMSLVMNSGGDSVGVNTPTSNSDPQGSPLLTLRPMLQAILESQASSENCSGIHCGMLALHPIIRMVK